MKAFDGQNHDAHIMSHLLFSASPIAAQTPSLIMALQKHVTEHVKIKSEEMAMMQFMQQSQGQPPSDDQMLEIEMMIAQNIAQELQALRQLSMQIAGQGQQQQGPDPLLALKEKEIGIKEQATMADIQESQAKLDLDRQKMMERSRQFDDRLQSQEQMTAKRLNAQAERELLRLRANRGN
jgi:hypothetical protein